VNRALRKAYGIGICSVEELGWVPRTPDPDLPSTNGFRNLTKDEHTNGQPRLRDRLCLLIRQHRLEPNLVKAYAADYCGTAALRDATRDQIEAFVDHLAERAKNDRGSLLDHLNSYSRSEEVAK
jgi:hypothetical protein